MGTTASTPSSRQWTRRRDASAALRWVPVDVSATDKDSSKVFVSQWETSPQYPSGRLVFKDVRDVDAGMASHGKYDMTDNDVELATRSFEEKYKRFRLRTAPLRTPWRDGHLRMRVHRDSLLVESMAQLLSIESDLLRMTMLVEVIDELVVPEGEWLAMIVEQLFDETLGLFMRARGDPERWTIYPHSHEASVDHLLYFRAVGRLLGRVLLGGLSLKTHLARPLLQHLLGVPVSLEDVCALDPFAYETLWKLQSSDIVGGVYDWEILDFTVTSHTLGTGERRVAELKENGRAIVVTDENKREYLALRMKHTLLDAFGAQMEHVMAGLFEVVPQEILLQFTPDELDRVLFDPPLFGDDAEEEDETAEDEKRQLKHDPTPEWPQDEP
jgi:E3 ubiquitin ligase SMURF1/2